MPLKRKDIGDAIFSARTALERASRPLQRFFLSAE
jgi:hypothetical protein